jgi:hypothetical protein
VFTAIGMNGADIGWNGLDEKEVLFGIDLKFRFRQFAAIPAEIKRMLKQVVFVDKAVESEDKLTVHLLFTKMPAVIIAFEAVFFAEVGFP